MREHITEGGLASRVRMLRSSHKGSFLLVEGDDDEKFFKVFIDRQACRIVIAHGKPRLLGALAILEAEHFAGIAAIADADFSALDGTAGNRANLFYTDGHDLEMMLLASPALDKVLGEFGNPQACESADVRKKLLKLGKPIGCLRWLSQRENLSLLFEGMDFECFIQAKTLIFHKNALLDELQGRSRKGIVFTEALLEQLDTLMREDHVPWYMCCGHDLVNILSIGLRHVFGSQKQADVEPARLERSLRLAYEKAYFVTTRLWASLKAWERANTPYTILSP